MPESEDRLEQIIGRLQRGKRLRLRRSDAADKEAIAVAARLAAARESYPRMSPAFRRHLADLIEPEKPGYLTRRSALVGGAAAAAGLVFGVGIDRGLGEQQRSEQHGGILDPEPGKWHDVAAVVDLPEGSAVAVSAGAVHGYVVRRGTTVTGVSSTCSHYPCALQWDGAARNILCPCHNQRFSLDGKPFPGAYPVPALSRLRVRVEGGRVRVLGT